jgi:hypothetical protein
VVNGGNANVGITRGGEQFELVVEQRHDVNYLEKQKRPEGRCLHGAKGGLFDLGLGAQFLLKGCHALLCQLL